MNSIKPKKERIFSKLLKALDQIDKIIETIKKSKNREEAQANLIKVFEFSTEQADAILNMRLSRLTSLERNKLVDEYEEKIKIIEKLQNILSSAKRLDAEIIKELKEIKEKFNDKRRTEIFGGPADDLFDSDIDLVKEEDVVITITKKGYVKRIPLYTYKQQGRGGVGIIGASIGDADYVSSLLVESTHDKMLLFTNVGKCYPLNIYQIPESSRTSRGVSLARMLNLDRQEIPQAVITLREMEENDNVVLVTKKGIIKKVKLLDFANAHSGGIIAQRMKEGDELFAAEKVEKGNRIFLAASHGQVIKFDESILRQIGRTAQGVIGMNIPNGESIISCVMGDDKIKDLVFVSDDGYGKRVDASEFRETNRGGKGVRGMKITKGRRLQRMVGVSGEEELMAISEAGKIIRLNPDGISKQHRNTRGVKVVSIKGEDKVTDIAIVTD